MWPFESGLGDAEHRCQNFNRTQMQNRIKFSETLWIKKAWMPCGHISQVSCSGPHIPTDFSKTFLFFLKCYLHLRLGECSTMPTPEAPTAIVQRKNLEEPNHNRDGHMQAWPWGPSGPRNANQSVIVWATSMAPVLPNKCEFQSHLFSKVQQNIHLKNTFVGCCGDGEKSHSKILVFGKKERQSPREVRDCVGGS